MRIPSFATLLTLIFISTIFSSCVKKKEVSEPATWAERLGFPAGKKVIILHADDAGIRVYPVGH